MNKVLRMHRGEVKKINAAYVSEELLSAAASTWDEAVELAQLHGVRNSQASVLAPTGTIGLMMDCDTTGIEPDLGLVKVKKLVGGGTMSIVNQTVPRALKALGYNRGEVEDIVTYIDVEKTIIGAPHLKHDHLNVFACSMGDNAIHYLGHVKMMSAVQPFISGAISKTVNMPEEATIEDVEQLHMDAWKMGLKAVAIYRDNCKVAQPLAMAKKEGVAQDSPAGVIQAITDQVMSAKMPIRREMPRVRNSKTFSFRVGDSKGFFTVGEFDDGAPGELFISTSKHGSTLRGLFDAFAISISYGLQWGVPLKSYVRTFSHMSFPPTGVTDDPDVPTANSIIDYIVRKLANTYMSFDDRLEIGLASLDDMPGNQTSLLEVDNIEDAEEVKAEAQIEELPQSLSASTAPTEPVMVEKIRSSSLATDTKDDTAPMCFNCGNQTQRAGSCYVCTSCGSTTGCS